ncbi:MAG TPA: trypsin-like peptidase domain-containing protein [Opitutaceae bacterium]|nr:trypsin-like peptidase domain-containing protein [Opitutaceae bacterium]
MPSTTRNLSKRALLSVFACLLLASCDTVGPTTPPTTPATSVGTDAPAPAAPAEPQPIDMAPGSSKPLAFQRVIINIEPGTTIGKLYWGSLKIEKEELKAPSPSVGSEQYALIAREELRKVHYNLLGGENLIFGDDESAKARYELGAQISGLRLNIYATLSFWTGKTSAEIDGNMTADWQVYDTLAHKVVYTHTTDIAVQTDESGESAVFVMFRKSLRQLLANPDFTAFMKPGNDDETQAAKGSSFNSALELIPFHREKALALPVDFPALLDGIVTIKPGSGFGAGFIITEDGYVLTAAHVVSGLKTVSVRLHNGLVLDADVVRVDEGADVALIKLPGTSHKPLELAPDTSTVGMDVYAIGNPALEEFSASVTKGVISGEREIAGHKFIQTDASINPGNSGGPLIGKDGRVLGIVSQKIVGPGLEGLAFAVPISEAISKLNLKLDSGTAK